jgi:hypothetical protein
MRPEITAPAKHGAKLANRYGNSQYRKEPKNSGSENCLYPSIHQEISITSTRLTVEHWIIRMAELDFENNPTNIPTEIEIRNMTTKKMIMV